jgi:putative nucleotidyltransferase with HDIG domain
MPREFAVPQPVLEVLRVIRGAGHQAVLAGGCVRDHLLGRRPKDYDVATSATPGSLAPLFPGMRTVGAHFGVCLVRRGGMEVEVATFRSDGAYTDGRRPDSVQFSSAEEDARRRDFTVNGLFYDPIGRQLIDHVGGEQDLRARLLRAIGDPGARFAEDHLRMLRAVRLATELDFRVDPGTFAAIQDGADAIMRISPERVRDELNRVWTHPRRQAGFDLLVESGLMARVLPEILDLRGCEQPPEFHPEGDVFTHTRLMLGLLPENSSLPLVLSVLLHDIAKPATQTVDAADGRIRFNGHDKLGAQMAENILRRLKYSNEIVDAVTAAVGNHMNFMSVQNMRASTLRRFLARPHIDDELQLHRADCLGSNGRLDNYEFLLARRDEFAARSQELLPAPLVNGRDLIAMGCQPGPHFAKILLDAQNLQLEGGLASREEALKWLRARAEELLKASQHERTP